MSSTLLLFFVAVTAKYCTFFLVLAVSSETTNDTFCDQKATWEVYMGFAVEAIGRAKNSSAACNNTTETRGQKEALMSHLHVADEMIKKANINLTCDNGSKTVQYSPDCSDLLRLGHRRSGVYTISPKKRLTDEESFEVFCDMEIDGGGWTVIQRRGDFGTPNDYFFKDWKSYKEGFGDLEKEFWLGNDNIFAITNQDIYSVRVILVDAENDSRYAHYEEFWIDGENSKYTLHLANYSGDAGDSMTFSNNQKFSTKDQDNDVDHRRHCAQVYKGGWWFKHCYQAHLNGVRGEPRGIIWMHWKGFYESLAMTEIKVRPANFRP